MASKFGGIPVDQPEQPKSEFGGIPMTPDQEALIQPSLGEKVGDYAGAVVGADYGKALSNTPSSALNIAKSAVYPVTHPIEFAKGLGETGKGMAERYITGVFSTIADLMGEEYNPETPSWNKLTKYYKDTYGSPEGLQTAIENDPMGIVADGLSVYFAGKSGLRSAKKLIGKLPESVPIGMYEEVAKLTNTKEFRNPAKRRQVLKSWLDEGIPFTEKGIKKMANIIDTINDDITKIIDQSPNKNIPRTAVLARIGELRKQLEGKFGATQDLAMVDRAVNSYLETVARQKSPNFSLKELNDFKKDAWKKVTDWAPAKPNKQKLQDKIYQNVGGTSAEIAGFVEPRIAPLNQRQAPLLAGREQLMNSVNRINKHNKLLNMSALIGTGAGEAIGSMLGAPGVGTAIGAGSYLMGKPGAKAPLARALYNARKTAPFSKPEMDLLKAMVSSYLARDEENQTPPSLPEALQQR